MDLSEGTLRTTRGVPLHFCDEFQWVGEELINNQIVIQLWNRACRFLSRRTEMGELTDRAKGAANKAVGGVKTATGKATDNENLRAKGDAQQSKGDAQKVVGKVKGALGDDV